MFLGKLVIGIILAVFISVRGYRKKSLDFSGAVGALIVGFISVVGGSSWGTILLFFFFSSSALTKYKADIKKVREDGYKEGGQRNIEQVIANGFFPTFICLLYQIIRVFQFENFETLYLNSLNGGSQPMELSRLEVHRYLYGNFYYFNATDYPLKTFLLVCYLCCYIANTSDTWSSEYGILSKREPIFILTLKKTYHGVNGGVSLSGYLASLMCGICYSLICILLICIDFCYARFIGFNEVGQMLVQGASEDLPFFTQLLSILTYQYPIVILCIFAALFGTTLDSILGAIFEYSGYDKERNVVVKKPGKNVTTISGLAWLNGNQVNFLAGSITGLVSATLSLWLFSY